MDAGKARFLIVKDPLDREDWWVALPLTRHGGFVYRLVYRSEAKDFGLKPRGSRRPYAVLWIDARLHFNASGRATLSKAWKRDPSAKIETNLDHPCFGATAAMPSWGC
jgi:hypothetical protein